MTVIFTPPAAQPTTVGLYGAANVIEYDDPTRLAQGLLLRNVNCGPSGAAPLGCADTQPARGGDRAGDSLFEGLLAWAVDDCGTGAAEADQRERAQQLLRLRERPLAEQHTAGLLAAAAPAPGAAAGLVAALGAVEAHLAGLGISGVVHAAAKWAAAAEAMHLIVRSGASMLTPLGNRWAFGGGYADLDGVLYGTGAVTVHRGPVDVRAGLTARTNERLVTAEREVVVAWECTTVAATI